METFLIQYIDNETQETIETYITAPNYNRACFLAREQAKLDGRLDITIINFDGLAF